MADNWQINTNRLTIFEVFDPVSGLPVTGLVTADFSITVLYNGAVPGSIPTVTISEIGFGRYLASWTPPSLGYWYLSIRDPVHNPQGWIDDLAVYNNTPDSPVSLSAGAISSLITTLLTYPLSGVEVAARGVRCLASVIQRSRNKVAITSPTIATIYESDNSTAAWTETIATSASQEPVVSEQPN